MKKLVPFLILIWLIIGIVSFAVWWKIVRNINTESVLVGANEIAREMNVPWAIRFTEVKPGYGSEFKLILRNLEIVNSDGDVLVSNKESEVRIPWVVFFKKSPVKINIFFRELFIPSTDKLLQEVEKYVDQQMPKKDAPVTLPTFIVDSVFNLRFLNIKGNYKGKDYLVEKVFLINADPQKPTTFEISFPWNQEVNGKIYSFNSKFLGEYRFSKQKIDLHFFSKNKIFVQDEFIDKSAELTFEGKGFYGSRLGFFSTLAAKEDWLGFVGDIEWTKNNFRLNIPRFSIHHDVLFDLYNVRPFQNLSKNYSQNTITGEMRVEKVKESPIAFDLAFQNKASAKVRVGGVEKALFMTSKNSTRQKIFELKLDDADILNLKLKSGVGTYRVAKSYFELHDQPVPWLDHVKSLMSYIDWIPWNKINVSRDDEAWFEVTRTNELYDISKLVVAELPLLNIGLKDNKIEEWSTVVSGESIDNLLKEFNIDHFGIPGFRYNASFFMKSNRLKFKSQWKGNLLPVLARSSCKALIQEKSDLSFMSSEEFTHTVEIEKNDGMFNILSWVAVSPKSRFTLSGNWANEPIKCQLKITQKNGRLPIKEYEVSLN